MHPEKTQRALYYWLFIGFVVAVSFYYLSPLTSYVFHSDVAIHVLMTYSFRWPEDVYYWGQDRLGSIVPAFGHLLYRCFHLSPILAAAISEYFFLIIGFLSFATLFKNKTSKAIFAIVWFLPHYAFQELIQLSQPYGEQACFLGLTVYFANKWRACLGSNKKALIFFSSAVLSVFISIWISDLSLVAYVLLVPLFIVVLRSAPGKVIFLHAAAFLFVSFLGFWFISYAKQVQPKYDDYSTHFFVPAADAFSVLGMKFGELYHTLIFETRNVLFSWHAWLFLAGLALTIYFLFSKKENRNSERMWIRYFIVYSLFCMIILLSSYWVSRNAAVNRYFTVLYVSIWIIVLLLVERLSTEKRKWLNGIFLTAALLSAASSVVPHYQEGRLTESFPRLEGFKKLGRIGIIGNYWRSYYVAAADPENIIATTCDTEIVRCKECSDSVMARPVIYLIQDNWLDSLPASIWQYSKELVRTGEPRNIGGIMTAPYVIKGSKNQAQ